MKATVPARVLIDGEQAAMNDLSKIAMANAMESDELKSYYFQGLLKAAGTLRKSAREKLVFSVNVDDLALGNAGQDYAAFLQAFTLTDTFDLLVSAVRKLPDYPALDYPKRTHLRQHLRHQIIIRVPKDNYARYIQIRGAYDDGCWSICSSALAAPRLCAPLRGCAIC